MWPWHYGCTVVVTMTRKQQRLEVAQSALFRKLADIHAALDRIERGNYGTCTRCEEPIDEALLAEDPARPVCRGCGVGNTAGSLRLAG